MKNLFCIGSAAQRRLTVRVLMAAGFSVVFAPAAALAFYLWHLRGVPAYAVAVVPALPILWVLYETGRWLAAEKDEFLRLVLVQCLLGGIGGTLAATTVWGFLEDFTHARHLHLVMVYPLFWLFVLVSAPVVWARYR